MCIHSLDRSPNYDDVSTHDVAEASEDQKVWSLVARMPAGTEQLFSAGVVRRDDGRLVVSLLNHAPEHADVGVVQWFGSADAEAPSYSLDYAVVFAERVVSEYEKPVTPIGQLFEALTGRAAFFAAADEAYPGFEPLPEADPQLTPEGFGEAA